MSSKSRLLHFPNTALLLVLGSTVVLLVTLWLIPILMSPFMTIGLLDRERFLIEYKFEQYKKIYVSLGPRALLSKLAEENEENLVRGIYVQLREGENQVWLTTPFSKEIFDLENPRMKIGLSEDYIAMFNMSLLDGIIFWFSKDKASYRKVALMKNGMLDQNMELSVARTPMVRDELLDIANRLGRAITILVTIVNAILGLIFFKFSLRALRDLVQGMQTLRKGDIKARVPVRQPRSELGTIARLFNESLDRIETLITGMKAALDNVAHDLKTPMARMRLTIEKAVQTKDTVVLQEALFDCAEEVGHIEKMLKSLMDVSEAETGVMSLRKEDFNLKDLISECLTLYEYPIEDKKLTVNLDIDDHLRLNADRTRIKQTVSNIIDNAVKYNKEDGHIKISARQSDQFTDIRVDDTGIGIDPADQEKIFDRLYRADKSRSTKGYGLGLSLVKAVVTAHEGSINVVSEPGKGASFILKL